jgi:hypothetical protein
MVVFLPVVVGIGNGLGARRDWGTRESYMAMPPSTGSTVPVM